MANTLSLSLSLFLLLLFSQSSYARSVDLTHCAESYKSGFIAFQGEAFLCANHPDYGGELFRTNGTPAGTKFVADVNKGSFSSNLKNTFELNGNLLFFTNDPVYGPSLWRTSFVNQTNQTKRIKSFNNSGVYGIEVVHRFGSNVIFHAVGSSFNVEGLETARSLWMTDGQETHLLDPQVFDETGFGFDNADGSSFLAKGDRLYYTTHNSLYRFNLLTQQSTLIKTFPFKPPFVIPTGFTMQLWGDSDGSLFYIQFGEQFGGSSEVWVSDGTTAGTSRIKSDVNVVGFYGGKVMACEALSLNLLAFDRLSSEKIFEFSQNSRGQEKNCSEFFTGVVAKINDRYVFDLSHIDYDLLSTDLTAKGTNILVQNSRALIVGVTNNKLIFSKERGGVFASGGTLGDAKKIINVNAWVPFSLYDISRFSGLIKPTNFLLFAFNAEEDRVLWTTDGTEGGSVKLLEIGVTTPRYLGNEGQRQFFSLPGSGSSGISGTPIWHSDGTSEGTYKLSFQIEDQGVNIPLPPQKALIYPLIQLLLEEDESNSVAK